MLTVKPNLVRVWPMPSKTAPPLGPHPPAYEKLLTRLAHSRLVLRWHRGHAELSDAKLPVSGSTKDPTTCGPPNSEGKTVCHALSQHQYHVAKQAIEANRQVMNILARLQTMTLKTILKKVPGVQGRK